MRSALILTIILAILPLVGCGPSAEEQATASFAQFAREWANDCYPGDPVLKETTEEIARGEATYNVEKGYYQRQTIFEGLQSKVVKTGRSTAPFLGILRGERVVRSTPVHADLQTAKQDQTFNGSRFVYPEEHVFEYVRGNWKARPAPAS
jgi:hypothetical protein